MFCSECGAKNAKSAKFCKECGKELKEIKEEPKVEKKVIPPTEQLDQGGLRKAIKKDAKEKVKGALIGATAIYMVAAGVIGGVSGNFVNTDADSINGAYGLLQLLVGLLAIVFSLGLTMVSFKAARGKDYEWTEVFTEPFNHIDRLGYFLLITIICAAIGFVAGILMIIPLLGLLVAIAFVVALIYFIPSISIFTLKLADVEKNEKIDFGKTIKDAIELSKGNRVEFYGMAFSFIGWCLLAILTCGILYIWLTPYMNLSVVNMYRKWIGEESFQPTETGLTNGTVIGLTAGGCGCGCLIFFIALAGVVAAILVAAGAGSNDPNSPLQKFIDKYAQEDKAEIQSDWNDILEDFNTEYNR